MTSPQSLARSLAGALLTTMMFSATPSLQAAGDFDHTLWNDALSISVDERGFVDYQALASDREALDRYVQKVAETSPETNPELFPTRDHELAYYINAYNALVFVGVLERGPKVDSVWGPTQSGVGFFVRYKVTVGGETLSLRALENEIIRERYADPRIHAALNCASVGCPRLPQIAFEGESLDEELEAAMREFVDNPVHVSLDRSAGAVALSKIFDWFRKDFETYEKEQGRDGELLDYINAYRTEKIATGVKVTFSEYDKRLNRQ